MQDLQTARNERRCELREHLIARRSLVELLNEPTADNPQGGRRQPGRAIASSLSRSTSTSSPFESITAAPLRHARQLQASPVPRVPTSRAQHQGRIKLVHTQHYPMLTEGN